jgi:membrane associated rhomboid family serine protease
MGIYERNYYREEGELNLSPTWSQRSAVSTLIIVNVAVFVANILFSQQRFDFAHQGKVNEFLLLSSSDFFSPVTWWRIVSYGFVHDAVSPMHLIFNMLGLYFLGRSVEDRYGRSEFYRIYFIALFICGFAWLLKQVGLGQDGRLLGASGAVLCIEMLFVFNFPTAKILLFVFPVPAWVLGVLLVLTNMVSHPSTGIAYDVHLVGILCATAYFFLGLNFRFMDNFPLAWRRLVRRLTGPKLKVHSGTENVTGNDADEADRILAKIHESGQESLTSREKKFLEKYSRSVRAKQKET